MTKQCNLEEIKNYRLINAEDKIQELGGGDEKTSLEKLQPFVPKYYGCDDSGGEASNSCKITLENLLFGKENASFIDIKLGTSTLTLDAQKRGVDESRAEKDKSRTTFEHGFTICGLCFKDPATGQSREKKYKLHPQYDEAKNWLAKLFKQGADGKTD